MENEKVSERNRPYTARATAKRFSSTIIILVCITRLLNCSKTSAILLLLQLLGKHFYLCKRAIKGRPNGRHNPIMADLHNSVMAVQEVAVGSGVRSFILDNLDRHIERLFQSELAGAITPAKPDHLYRAFRNSARGIRASRRIDLRAEW